MPFDWNKWLPLIMGGASAGTGLIGAKMVSNQMNRGNDLSQLNSQRMYDMAQQERQRRDQLSRMIMPNLMQGMGVSGPQARQYIGQMPSDASPGPATSNSEMSTSAPVSVPQTPTSKTSKVMGGIGGGLGIAGSLRLAGALGPAAPFAAPALMLGGLAANKIGQGRRTANLATGDGGFEKTFVDALTRISAGGGSLKDLQAAKQAYDQNTKAWIAQGGNQAKVAQQSLNNQPLQQTYQTLLRQLGGQA